MNKVCVFCGKKPIKKNHEHVIPNWLIQITGEPKRSATFGPFWDSKNRDFVLKEFAFDQFKFPSCEQCNNTFSSIEIRAKSILSTLLNNGNLSANDFSHLLSWFDKVRVGLWLAYLYLSKNVLGIDPRFYITNRIDLTDRLLVICRSDYVGKRVIFMGANVPAFQYLPCCFTLIVNEFFLFNIARDSIISRQFGLPYVKREYFTDDTETKFVFAKGRDKIIRPIIRKRITPGNTQIFQPMLTRKEYKNIIDEYVDTSHIYSICSEDTGIGKIFIDNGSSFLEYPNEPTMDWLPRKIHDNSELVKDTWSQTLEFQIYLLNRNTYYGDISEDKKNLIKEQMYYAKKINRLLIDNDNTIPI